MVLADSIQILHWQALCTYWDEIYLAEWLERLTANAVVATVLGSIPASSDTVGSEGRADEALLNIVHKKRKKFKKIPLLKNIGIGYRALGIEIQGLPTLYPAVHPYILPTYAPSLGHMRRTT